MDENSPEAMFNKQQELMQKRNETPLPGMKPQGDTTDVHHQKVLNEVQATIGTSTPVAPVAASQGQCPQCNLIHPPLGPGKKCPNAKLEVEGVSDSQINLVVVQIRDILVSQLEQKGVKKYDQFKNGLVMALMKYCEEYKE